MNRATRILGLLTLAAVIVAMGAQAPAAFAAQRYDPNSPENGLLAFDQFLSHHPWIAHKLWQKPSRANSKDFQGDNPELKYFLENYPWVRNQLRIDARNFMERERNFEQTGGRYVSYSEYGPWNSRATRAQMAEFSQFLDDNPGLARQLAHNPAQVDNPGYLHHHKELLEFLEAHPAVRERLNQNPSAFFGWYGSYESEGR